MRPLSTRERWGIALLVPVVLAGLYLVLLRTGPETTLEAASKRLASARPAAKPAGKGAAALQRDLDTAIHEQTRLEAERNAWRARWSVPEERTATVEAISQRFADAGLVLRGSGAASTIAGRAATPASGSVDSLCSPSLRDLDRLARELGAPSAQLWRFELSGSYESACRAVDRVAHSSRFALPVALSMQPSEFDADLDFTLWVWI